MLDAFVIEEIKRRERDKGGRDDRPAVELPVPAPAPSRPPEDDEERPDRGVVIIDYSA